jgi:hypothetical protein
MFASTAGSTDVEDANRSGMLRDMPGQAGEALSRKPAGADMAGGLHAANGSRGERPATGIRKEGGGRGPWSRDEWDVALSDGAVYRIFRDRVTDAWFIDGVLD